MHVRQRRSAVRVVGRHFDRLRDSAGGAKKRPDLSKRLRTALRESAIEMGKGLAKAVIEEVVELAKSRDSVRMWDRGSPTP